MTNETTCNDAHLDDTRGHALLGGEGHHLLIVEDDPAIRQILATAFEAVGFNVRTAEDGIAALAQLRRAVPDVVVTDLAMPRMSGDRLATELMDWGLPIILTSAYRDDPELPGTVFVPKPFDLDHLIETVRHAIAAPDRSMAAAGSAALEQSQ